MRKVADCRDYPSVNGCTLTIAGEEDEVIQAATQHAVSAHGEKDTPKLRQQIREMLKDDDQPSPSDGHDTQPAA